MNDSSCKKQEAEVVDIFTVYQRACVQRDSVQRASVQRVSVQRAIVKRAGKQINDSSCNEEENRQS